MPTTPSGNNVPSKGLFNHLLVQSSKKNKGLMKSICLSLKNPLGDNRAYRIIPFSKWLITMVIVSPLRIGWFPFQMGVSWLINGGDPNHVSDTWEPILQVEGGGPLSNPAARHWQCRGDAGRLGMCSPWLGWKLHHWCGRCREGVRESGVGGTTPWN